MEERRSAGQSLTQEERESYSTKALEMRARGISIPQISRTLNVSQPTVRKLLDYSAESISDDEKARIRATTASSINAVKRRAWSELDKEDKHGERIIRPTSHNLPQLLSRILEADDRMIRLYHLDRPDEESSQMATTTAADRIKAYEEAKRQGKVRDIHGDRGQESDAV